MPSYSSRAARFSPDLIRLARPVHWIKNGFVLAPVLFTLDSAGARTLASALLAFVAFSLTASAIYIVNDIADLEHDRQNPTKLHRPLPMGTVSIQSAVVLAGCFAILSTLDCLILPWKVGAVLAGYAALNILYTFKLKDIVLIDVMTISAGFMLRVFAGAAAIEVAVSPWMIHTTFFLSLFLGFSKRRNELVSVPPRLRRRVLRDYSESFLNLMLAISLSLTIVTYSLYVIQPVIVERARGDGLLYTVPVVVFGLLRYLYLVVRKRLGGDVAEIVIGDPWLVGSVILWAAAVVLLLAAHP